MGDCRLVYRNLFDMKRRYNRKGGLIGPPFLFKKLLSLTGKECQAGFTASHSRWSYLLTIRTPVNPIFSSISL